MTDQRPTRPRRKSLRIPDYDYSQPGYYFITICTRGIGCVLSQVDGDAVRLTSIGTMVDNCWQDIPRPFPHVTLDSYVLMPNHMHGILVVGGQPDEVRARHDSDSRTRRDGTSPGSLGAAIQAFKAIATRRYNNLVGTSGPALWQRNYYEHVIRSEKSLSAIREYIALNPLRWSLDKYYVCA